MTDFVYVNDLPEDDTPSIDARAMLVNETGTELVQGPVFGDLSNAAAAKVPDATQPGEALAHSQPGGVLNGLTLDSGGLVIEAGVPFVEWKDNSGTADGNRYRLITSDTEFEIRALGAGGAILFKAIGVKASTGAVDMSEATSVALPATTVDDDLSLSGTTPSLLLEDTNGTTDQRYYRIQVQGGDNLLFQSLDNGGSSTYNFMRFTPASGSLDMSGATLVELPDTTVNGALTATGANPEAIVNGTTQGYVTFQDGAGTDRLRIRYRNSDELFSIMTYNASGVFQKRVLDVTADGAVDMSEATSVTVPAPTVDASAATKKYVDDAIAAAIAALGA